MDLALADVVSTSSDFRLGSIRLAWWRERLEEMDAGEKTPAEPRLQAVAAELLPRGVSGHELSDLEQGWGPLLEPFPWSDFQASGLILRGRLLFGAGARLLGGNPRDAEEPGALWSLIDGIRHCSDPGSRAVLFERACQVRLPAKTPRALRPLTILAALSISSLDDRSISFDRGTAAIWHRLTGRYRKFAR